MAAFGFFRARTRGSHHICRHRLVPAVLSIQDRQGQAKAYQVRQLLALVEEYNLRLEDEP